MKVYDYKSKVLTDYEDSQLTKRELVFKRRLEIAVTARNIRNALRTFKNSKFITT